MTLQQNKARRRLFLELKPYKLQDIPWYVGDEKFKCGKNTTFFCNTPDLNDKKQQRFDDVRRDCDAGDNSAFLRSWQWDVFQVIDNKYYI